MVKELFQLEGWGCPNFMFQYMRFFFISVFNIDGDFLMCMLKSILLNCMGFNFMNVIFYSVSLAKKCLVIKAA